MSKLKYKLSAVVLLLVLGTIHYPAKANTPTKPNSEVTENKPILVETKVQNAKAAPDVRKGTLDPATQQGRPKSPLPSVPGDLLAAGGCESANGPQNKPRQFDGSGAVIKHYNLDKLGRITSTDYGAFQINSSHLLEAKALGLDFINSEEDNYKMALVIYKTQGIGAWNGYDSIRKTCSYY